MSKGIKWLPEEEELLRFADKHGVAVRAVAELLQRSRYSVHRKNHALGLGGHRRHSQTTGDWTLEKVLERHGGAAVTAFVSAMQARGLAPEDTDKAPGLCVRNGCYRPRYGKPRALVGLCLEHHTRFFGAP